MFYWMILKNIYEKKSKKYTCKIIILNDLEIS